MRRPSAAGQRLIVPLVFAAIFAATQGQESEGPVVTLTAERAATNDVLRVTVTAADASMPLTWSLSAKDFIVSGPGACTGRPVGEG